MARSYAPPKRSGHFTRSWFSVHAMKRPVLAAVALAFAAGPAIASAATIEMRPAPTGSSVIAYDAAPGEVNALSMSGTISPGDFRMGIFEFSAPLIARPGCAAGTPVVCGEVDRAFPVIVTLNDESDVANVNSFTSTVNMDAGSGDDDVLAGGIDASADGGPGNDTIRLAANNLTTGQGGTGRDRIAAGLGAAAARLDGGSGNDLLVPGGFLFNEADGGHGADRLVSFTGRDVTLNGQAGSDVLVAAGGSGIVLNGGSGSDVIASELGGVTVSAGSGWDLIDVRGPAETSADTVSCGPGVDVVWANRADDVARDCEIELGFNPSLGKVAAAIEDAHDLLAHIPDPS
jgi:Ca2+-binding RTX toxin-like protein